MNETVVACNAIAAFNNFLCRVKYRVAEIMNKLLTKLQPDGSPENKEKFSALIAYEDSLTRDRAMRICDRPHAGRELPSAVQKWIETWLPLRKSGGGVLAAMIGTGQDQYRGLTPIHVYLREAAQRANMDFLSQMSYAPLGRLDGSIETITNRAEKVTSLLDNILHRPSNPLRWGINE